MTGWVLAGIVLYFLPSIVGQVREKRNSSSISVVNLFLGWTVIGWVVALAWACAYETPRTATEREAER